MDGDAMYMYAMYRRVEITRWDHSDLSLGSLDPKPSRAQGPLIPFSSRSLVLSSRARCFSALYSSHEIGASCRVLSEISDTLASLSAETGAFRGRGRTASSPNKALRPERKPHSTAFSTGSSKR
jgi:hypothetical protein